SHVLSVVQGNNRVSGSLGSLMASPLGAIGSRRRVICRAGFWGPEIAGERSIQGRQPLLRKHLLCESLVNMRHDQAIERKEGELSFVPASSRAIFGQIPLVDQFGEQLPIGAIGDTQQVEETLLWSGMDIRKFTQLQ